MKDVHEQRRVQGVLARRAEQDRAATARHKEKVKKRREDNLARINERRKKKGW